MDPLSLSGTVLLLPLASALIIMLFHGPLKRVAHVISVGVATIICICALMLLAAGDHADVLLFPFLKTSNWSLPRLWFQRLTKGGYGRLTMPGWPKRQGALQSMTLVPFRRDPGVK